VSQQSLLRYMPHILIFSSARKIGCDQKLPQCLNCVRTGRECEGYGIRLHWPESADGRRPLFNWESKSQNLSDFVSTSKSGEFHFLNTTYEDLQSQTSSVLIRRGSFRISESSTSISRGLNVGFDTNNLVSEDQTLLSYCRFFSLIHAC
jgi:hypothetical protein